MKLFQRIWRVLRKDEDAFFEIGLDGQASWQAFGLVLLVGLISASGWVLRSGYPFPLLVSLTAGAVIAWLIFAGWAGFLEMLLKGGDLNRGEVLRVTGFAALPLMLLSIPYIGWLSVIWFWGLTYVALRSLYSTKPTYTLLLIGTGSLTAFMGWGLTVLIIYGSLTNFAGT